MSSALRPIAWVLAVGLLVLPVVAVLNGWIGGQRWPMRSLSITGQFKLVDEQAVRTAVAPYASRGFFAVDLLAARRAVAGLAWVEQVEVRKRWPDQLEIALVEHRPVARWGDQRMLSESGQIFPAPDGSMLSLPLLNAADHRAAEVMTFYEKASQALSPANRRVSQVDLSARDSWSIVLDDGLQIEVGRRDTIARINRFAGLLEKIKAEDTRSLQHADLRYTNGFALRWQGSATPANANPPQALLRNPT